MGISWKMRFYLVQLYNQGLRTINEQRDEPRDASFILDRMSEFMEDVQSGSYDHVLIYKTQKGLEIIVTKDRDKLWSDAVRAIENP